MILAINLTMALITLVVLASLFHSARGAVAAARHLTMAGAAADGPAILVVHYTIRDTGRDTGAFHAPLPWPRGEARRQATGMITRAARPAPTRYRPARRAA